MEPPSSHAPVAIRRGPFVPEPGPDPREVMAHIEHRVRELAAQSPSSSGPMSLRGDELTRALRDVPAPSGIRLRH